jgi:hypothetical protein
MLNLDAVHTPPRRRRVETVRRVSYRVRSTRRRVTRGLALVLALGALGCVVGGLHREALALVALAVVTGGVA